MTIEEFNNTGFTGGMEVKISGETYDVISADFEDKTIGIEIDGKEKMIHCKLCEWIRIKDDNR